MIKFKELSLAIVAILLSGNLYAQSGSFGSSFIHSGAEVVVHANHNFKKGSSGVFPGIVGTERALAKGFLSFANLANPIGASDTNYVDGYVKTYNAAPFIFPIGDNGFYRPVGISTSNPLLPINAAYFKVNPSIARTSSLKGGLEPILPVGGPFSILSKDTGIYVVDSMEYWDINGDMKTEITLSWTASSQLSKIINSNLSNLTILGWEGSRWVKIESVVDVVSIFGTPSTITSGSITTANGIIPNEYSVYTIGNGCTPPTGSPIISCVNAIGESCDTLCKSATAKKYYVSGVINALGYKWTISNGATIISGQGTDTIVVNFNTSVVGNALLCVSPYNGCDTLRNASCKSINVLTSPPKPNSGSDVNICVGGLLRLNVSGGSPGVPYTWRKPDGTLFIGNSINIASVTSLDSGLYIVSQFNQGCYSVTPDTVLVSVQKPPVINFVLSDTGDMCELATKSLSASPPGGNWTIISGGGNILGGVYIPGNLNRNTNVVLRYTLVGNFAPCANPYAEMSFMVVNIRNEDLVDSIPCTGGSAIPDFRSKVCFNGNLLRLGVNSKVNNLGTWPPGFTIDSMTGKVSIQKGTPLGSYILRYILCDTSKPTPICIIDTLTIVVTPVINPVTDTGMITLAGGVAVVNITDNDSINAWKAILGTNAFIEQAPGWPINFTLDKNTGKVTVAPGTAQGIYTLYYRLCDSFNPPNCEYGAIIIRVIGLHKSDTIWRTFTRLDEKFVICTTQDDLIGINGTRVHSLCNVPKGYLVIGPDSNGCFTYRIDSANIPYEPVMTCQITCINGLCDTTFIILTPNLNIDIRVPNYISPNGDGSNDLWVIPSPIYLKYPNLSVTIYNRWGNVVWRSIGVYKNDWGGTNLHNDSPVPDGVYYYLIELEPGFKVTKTGFVEVMR